MSVREKAAAIAEIIGQSRGKAHTIEEIDLMKWVMVRMLLRLKKA